MSEMELRHLRHLEALAQSGSFHRAAQRLGLRQPALSLSIRALEAAVGVPLVVRTTSGSRLTEAGKAFLEEIGRVFAVLDTAKLVARGVAGVGTVPLRLGIAVGAATGWMMTALRTFIAIPHHKVVVSDGPTAHLLAELREGILDICVFLLSAGLDEPAFEPLWYEDVHLALSTEHPLARKSAVNINWLSDELLVVDSGGSERGATASLLAACRQAGVRIRTSPALVDPEVRSALIAAGIGVAAQPASIRSFYAVTGTTTKPLIPPLNIGIAAAFPRTGPSSIAREFIEHARFVARAAAP